MSLASTLTSCSEVNFSCKLFIAWRNWVHKMLKLEPPSTGLLLNISNNWCSPPSPSWQGTGDDQKLIFNRWLFFSEPLLLWKWSPRAEPCRSQAAWTREEQWHSVRNTSSSFFDNVTLDELLSSFEAKCPKAYNEDNLLIHAGSLEQAGIRCTKVLSTMSDSLRLRTPFFWGSAYCGSIYRFMTKNLLKCLRWKLWIV